MATGGQKRTRSERVAALELTPGQWERTWASLQRRDVLARIGLALVAAVAMGVVIRAWNPPFAYRTGYYPPRDVRSRFPFVKEDTGATEKERERARNQVPYTYVNDSQPLVQLRAKLLNTVIDNVTRAATLADLDEQLWEQLQLPPVEGAPAPAAEDPEKEFQRFRAAFAGQENRDRFEMAIRDAFAPFEKRGLLENFSQQNEEGNQQEILVRPADDPQPLETVLISDVLIGDGAALHDGLAAQFELAQFASPPDDLAEVAQRLFAWLQPRLAEAATLKLDETAETVQAMDQAAAAVEPVMKPYPAGESLAKAGQSLDEQNIELLRLEYDASLDPPHRSAGQKIARGTAVIAMIFAMFVLCGIYMRYRQRGPLASVRRLSMMLALAVITVGLSRWCSAGAWRVEIIPLMLFGMTVAIAYRQELALLLSGVLAVILVLAVGHGLHEFLLLMGVTTAANLNMGRIRSRSKLIYVGLLAGAVAVVLDVTLGVVDDQPLLKAPLGDALRSGLLALAAGFLMTGLLPFIERLFGVLTDLSLLELGDVAHPLLQELVRRAPSTYNHSITVGSIAEAAAESIGARGLLVRVGAYFHDIGKLLKPGYFIENQGSEASRHETLVPAMSTLVIIAHIKDGANLARQHHLPQPIIDLIEQHHGTTLVGYFYERGT